MSARLMADGLPHQVHHHAAGYVVNVQRALAQVRDRPSARAGLRVTVGDLLEDGFDVAMLALQRAQHLVDERAVLDDEQVRVEDAGVLRADGVGDLRLHVQDLRAREQQRRLEPGDFRRELSSSATVWSEVVSSSGAGRKCLAPREPGRHPQTLETLLGA